MLRTNDFYIDLGTANTLVYAKKRGFVLNEPTVLAVRHRSESHSELFALGRDAKVMLGKSPENLSVMRPLREGVVADFDNAVRMLHAFVKKAKENVFWLRPRLIISLPCQVSRFERRAVEEIGYELGASSVQLLEEPVAAAIGAGLAVLGKRGQMIVDIGGGTTEIAIIALGGIVTSTAVRAGGDDIDEAIITHLKTRHHFLIGEQTAERIKIEVADVNPVAPQSKTIEIGGFNLLKRLPTRLLVDTNMILPAVDSVVREIITAIRKALEECPPEIAGDIAESGLVLAGGGALLGGLRERIAQEIGIPVKISDQPLLSVALGGAKALEDSKLFDGLEKPA